MKTNDLKKGDVVWLKNGWRATIADNMKGNTRMATVEGFFTETGSIYVWDISHTESGEPIELTDRQIKAMNNVKAWGF